MPKVSVVLPTYNRASLLKRAAKSVLDQSESDLELIIVDDGSSDNSEEIVKALTDDRVRYLRHETNKGGSAARNTGIAAARAPLIAFQDSDDEWAPDKLTKQLRLMEASGPEVVSVYSGLLRHDGQFETYIPGAEIVPREGDLSEIILRGNFVSTQTLLVRREALDRAGHFDESLPRYQDWDLAIRLTALGHFKIVDEPLVHLHMTLGNITSDSQAGAAAFEILLAKHADRLAKYPDILTQFRYSAGLEGCLYGDLKSGRRYLREILCADPSNGKVRLLLFLSYLGRPTLDLALRLRRGLSF